MAESVLDRIVQRKRTEVAERLGGATSDARPTRRSLSDALRKPGARFIMEVKKASPSGHRSTHSVDEAVRAYAPAADAISVLTDGPDFGGRLEDIAAVRRRFDGPILAKDFIVDARQVAEARRHGADAILVILSALDDSEAAAVLAEARRLSMDAITEVHDERELGRAVALGAAIIGINNRDLRTLRTDLEVTRRLAPSVPKGVLAISESGIRDRSDVKALSPFVDGFLVGSALMASPDIGSEARALVHGRVKICGFTREEDVAAAAAYGATHAGFVFVPGTPRAVDAQTGQGLSSTAAALGLKRVGIFRDSKREKVIQIADSLALDAVQLHGSETQEDIESIRNSLDPGVEIWAACSVAGDACEARPGADRLLFDSGSGGTGRVFDWTLVEGREDLPTAVLAGGINAGNAREADAVGAYAIDVGSGVEAEPGRKDSGKLRDLFAALRPDARRSECA
ncbi:MAG: bifunctional indole-3-glycerol-phosphate synthase TrpC/phosphoribosylanthranilate isomerase TrpF [Sphingomonas sp.]|nr:bifunctional indole-3-glycerol-phosphate synthase TrpC/phosphoribosylanthranilate isomerase TrpF [Sphingomonas sp.]